MPAQSSNQIPVTINIPTPVQVQNKPKAKKPPQQATQQPNAPQMGTPTPPAVGSLPGASGNDSGGMVVQPPMPPQVTSMIFPWVPDSPGSAQSDTVASRMARRKMARPPERQIAPEFAKWDRSLQENLKEKTTHLAYADWLEEQGMPVLAGTIRHIMDGKGGFVYGTPMARYDRTPGHHSIAIYNGDKLTRVVIRSPWSHETKKGIQYEVMLPKEQAHNLARSLVAEGHPSAGVSIHKMLNQPAPTPPATPETPEQLARKSAKKIVMSRAIAKRRSQT